MDKKGFGGFAATLSGLVAACYIFIVDNAYVWVGFTLKILSTVLIVFLSHLATKGADDAYARLKMWNRRRKMRK